MTNPTAPFRSEIPDEEFAALVTVETMDRLVRRAVVMLQAGQDTADATDLLLAARAEAQVRLATAVKDQGLSDRIAHDAITNVRQHIG
jgi:hypothetical protein